MAANSQVTGKQEVTNYFLFGGWPTSPVLPEHYPIDRCGHQTQTGCPISRAFCEKWAAMRYPGLVFDLL